MNLLPKLQALANPHRLHIAQLCLKQPRDVGEISAAIGLSQSATSQHLAHMRHAGLLTYVRDGTRFIYHWNAVYPNGFFASVVGMHSL